MRVLRRALIFGDELRNYYVTRLCYAKTDITTEFPIVDLVLSYSLSSASSKFEIQSRMSFQKIHMEPSLRILEYQFWKPLKNAIRWYA